MKVSINAGKINQIVNAETAHVSSQKGPVGDTRGAEATPLADAEPRWEQLSAQLPTFAADLTALQQLIRIDHGSALNKMRYIVEKVLLALCDRSGTSWGQGEPTLERMIGPLLAGGALPKTVGLHVRTVQTNASPGSHYQEAPLTEPHVRIAQAALEEVLAWFAAEKPPS
jgi:hypothetical protein